MTGPLNRNDLSRGQQTIRLRGNKPSNLLAVLPHAYTREQGLEVGQQVFIVLERGDRMRGYTGVLRHMPLGHVVSVPTDTAREWGLTNKSIVNRQVVKR